MINEIMGVIASRFITKTNIIKLMAKIYKYFQFTAV